MKNMNDLLRQAQVMQNKIARLQQEMAEKDVEASAGGGMVKVVMNGRQEMKSIIIDKSVMESGDAEMLQDLVITGCYNGNTGNIGICCLTGSNTLNVVTASGKQTGNAAQYTGGIVYQQLKNFLLHK